MHEDEILNQSNILVDRPIFKETCELTNEQLTDPDYALKQLLKIHGDDCLIICSKCHHCR